MNFPTSTHKREWLFDPETLASPVLLLHQQKGMVSAAPLHLYAETCRHRNQETTLQADQHHST